MVTVASPLGLHGGVGLAPYVAAEVGVFGRIRAMALELAPFISGGLPLGRFGRAEEVAPSVLFLGSSPDGDLYVGTNLGPNSGDVMS